MWKKLQLKTNSLVILNPPNSFSSHVAEISSTHNIHSNLSKKGKDCGWILSFVTSKCQLVPLVKHLSDLSVPDPVVWVSYPKMSSKLYDKKTSDIGQRKGFESMASVDFEPVSSVSIDSDWSALRFRRVEHIGKMTRSFALTDEGKAKVARSRAEGIGCGSETTKSVKKARIATDEGGSRSAIGDEVAVDTAKPSKASFAKRKTTGK